MGSVIERIKRANFWTFHGGIHPPEQKFLTTDKPIRAVSIPEQLILPLQQHIGIAADLRVKVGDKVLKGQALTQSMHPMAVPIHAPTSGTITAIKNAVIAHPSGLSELCLFIKPDGEDTWQERHICTDVSKLSHNEIIDKISSAGISGMGGAGFPTQVKISTRDKIQFLIINAAECEPYISADDLLIREHSPSILDGINILDRILSPEHILIGIENNKPEAIKVLQQATANNEKIQVCVVPTKYPTGGEKQLIQILTGQEVPSGIFPSSMGIVMQNIATCFAIADAVINDIPLIKRVVTVSGQALQKPQNVWSLLGTPVGFLLEQCGYPNKDKKHIIMGGPMMGYSLPTDQVPVVKTTNCILAPSEQEISSPYSTGTKEVECIRCGQCSDVCPSQLLPQELQWSAKAKDHQQLDKLNLFDCIECGACAYVCPSQIPLVHYYRVAKSEIRQQKQLDLKAEHAKVRFEARKERLARDKIAREEKHKTAAEARKARMNSGTSEAKTEKSAVAAALARVKAKKAQQTQGSENVTAQTEAPPVENEQKSQVSAAIARAKAKKLAAQQNTATYKSEPQSALGDVPPAIDDKKAKIANAVAKAKARKLAEKNKNSADDSDITLDNSIVIDADAQANQADMLVPADDKKAKIAKAVAKAKARKLADKNKNSADDSDLTLDNNIVIEADAQANQADMLVPADDKKAKIAKAVAKAKARKLAEKNTNSADDRDLTLDNNIVIDADAQANQADMLVPADDKKAKIAAAIAKAKARKLAQQQSKSTANTSEEKTNKPVKSELT
ncbi:MAG: electron transport complex protein RnfC [Colwellia sp.]